MLFFEGRTYMKILFSRFAIHLETYEVRSSPHLPVRGGLGGPPLYLLS